MKLQRRIQWLGLALTSIFLQSVANPYFPTDVASSSSLKKPRSLFPSFQLKESQNKHFRLGFAGRIETLCIGACGDTEFQSTSDRQPLFWEVNRPWFPSLYVAADYDFATCRYGVTHCSTSVQCQIEPWKRMIQSNLAPVTLSSKRSNLTSRLLSQLQSSLCRVLPSTVEVSREHAVFEPSVATIWSCQWPWRRSKMKTVDREIDAFTLQHRKCRESVTTTLSIPLHSRVRVKFRFLNELMEAEEFVTQTSNCADDDWWIPNVSVDALGLMESKNRIWLQNQRIRLSLSVRRRLNWSALGLLGHDDFEYAPTRIQFQVRHRSPTKSSMVEISSFINQPLASASVLLQQEFFLGS